MLRTLRAVIWPKTGAKENQAEREREALLGFLIE